LNAPHDSSLDSRPPGARPADPRAGTSTAGRGVRPPRAAECDYREARRRM